MKLTCDLCGGQLMVGSGGQGASCTVCGLLYSMERLREKLGAVPSAVVTPPVQSTVKVKISKKKPVLTPSEDPEPWRSEPSTPTEEPPVEEPPVEEPFVEEPPVEKPPVEEPPVVVPPAEEPPVVEPSVPTGYFPPKPPASYWIPPMDPPIAPLFAMELRGVSFSTIRGIVLSGSVTRGSQLLLGSSICSVISCKPAQLTPGTYAELTISNCPSKNALKHLLYIIGCSPELAQLNANALNYPGSPKAYMSRVLQAAFSDFQIQVTNAPAPKDPVTFTFHQFGQKKLVVILCHGNRYESQPVLQLIEQCRLEGVPCLRFFENFWNNREYIIGRIRKTLCG